MVLAFLNGIKKKPLISTHFSLIHFYIFSLKYRFYCLLLCLFWTVFLQRAGCRQSPSCGGGGLWWPSTVWLVLLESQKVHNIKDDHENIYFVSNDSTGLSCFKVRFLTEINVPDQKKKMYLACFTLAFQTVMQHGLHRHPSIHLQYRFLLHSGSQGSRLEPIPAVIGWRQGVHISKFIHSFGKYLKTLQTQTCQICSPHLTHPLRGKWGENHRLT